MAQSLATNEAQVLWASEVSRHWGWILALGILFTLAGVVGLGMVVTVTFVSLLVFGVLALVGTIAHAIQMFRMPRWRDSAMQAITAMLYLIIAGFIFFDPTAAAISLTLVLAIVLAAVGVLRILGSVDARPMEGWGWMLAHGILDLLLAGLIIAGWPVTGLFAIGVFISVDLLFAGITYLILATVLHQRHKVLSAR